MALRPGFLLSSASKARCLANIKELPSLIIEKSIPESERVHCAVLLPLCVMNEQVCLLYTLRSSALVRHSGQVSFPGGKRDNNETSYETALRETEEEIGFPREQVDVWGSMKETQGRDSKMLITPVIGQLNNFLFENLVPNSDEVDEVFTVSMESLCDADNHAHFMYNTTPLPVYVCGKHKIWGITGMITHFFLLSFLSSEVYNPDFMRKNFKLEELLPSKL